MRTLLLTFIQIIICLLIVISAYIIKAVGADSYTYLRNIYYDNLNYQILVEAEDEI